jgi:hydroxymethylglutaryl-CoA lyase
MKVLENIPNPRAGRNPDSEIRIHLYEVGFRDWRFSHRLAPDTDSLVTTIRMLEEAGIERIEIGASVNYIKYPELRDTYEILRRLRTGKPKAKYGIYVGPTEKNYPSAKITRLLDKGMLPEHPGLPDEICVSISASEERNFEIYQMSGNSVFDCIQRHVEKAHRDGMRVRGYVSAAFGGYKDKLDAPISSAIGWCQLLFGLGCYEVALGDTRGKADPEDFNKMWDRMKSFLPLERIALHIHAHWYLNWESHLMRVVRDGVHTFDTSVFDIPEPTRQTPDDLLPFDLRIPPNASTQKMVSFVNQLNTDIPLTERTKMGAERFSTGVDFEKVREAVSFIRGVIHRQKPAG